MANTLMKIFLILAGLVLLTQALPAQLKNEEKELMRESKVSRFLEVA